MRNETTDWMVVDSLGLEAPVCALQYGEACDLAQELNALAGPLLDHTGQPVARYAVQVDTDKIRHEILGDAAWRRRVAEAEKILRGVAILKEHD